MSRAHTPTPWSRNIPPVTKYSTVFAGRNTHVLSIIVDRGMSPEEAEANCEFLLRAVNSHDALVEALHAIIALDHHNMGPESRATKIARDALNAMEVAP